MSGPKVVVVVTLQEVLNICAHELAKVDAALGQWERTLKRNGLDTEELMASVRQRRVALNELLKSEQYLAIQKRAPMLVEWLHHDLRERLDAKLLADEAAAKSGRHLTSAAESILAECKTQGLVLNAQDQQALAGTDIAAKARAISAVLSLRAKERQKTASAEQSQMTARLKEGQSVQSLQDWFAATGYQDQHRDPRFAIAQRQIQLLSSLGREDLAASYGLRLENLRHEEEDARMGMLLDALCLDTSGEVAKEREGLALREQIEALQACLGIADPIESNDLEALKAKLAELNSENLRRLSAIKAEAARDSVLQGLKELGYEVREGMGTIWADKGKLVVKHTKTDGYGLELAGRAETGKMQVRAVSFQERGAEADKQAEDSWCGELGELEKLLAAGGNRLSIERATPSGAQPVKRVVFEVETEAREEVEELRLRRMGE